MTITYQLDANVVLRFLLNDHKEFSAAATKLIRRANEGEVILELSAVTVAEIFYALKVSYGVDRRKAARMLAGLLNTPAFELSEPERIMDALGRVEKANVDFGDAYLAAAAFEKGAMVASFDRDLDKFADVKRYQPA